MKALLLSMLFFIIPTCSWANPANLLEDYDRDYYLQIFDYVMDYSKNANPYPWKANDGRGTISVGREYLSKSNVVCRDFAEFYTIKNEKGAARGAGCKREGAAGWCRVSERGPRTCATESLSEGDQAIDKAKDVLGEVGNMLR